MEPTAPQTQYVKTADGVYIAYQVVGDGPIDLVLLDGWVTPLEHRWEHPPLASALRRLASFARVISFDKRGIGLSDPVPLNIASTLEEWTDDISTVMAAVGSDRAALFGHHDGGWPAILFAAGHPSRVSHLVLVNTSARLPREPGNPWGIPIAFLVREDRILEYSDPDSPLVNIPEEFKARWMQWFRHQASPGTFLQMGAMQRSVDLRGILGSVQAPTLVVHRAENQFWRVGHGRYLGENIPGARYKEVSGRHHQWHIGDADAIVDEVEEFLTGTRPAAGIDRVLATVLFTDVVASTEALSAMGDRAWRGVLDDHERHVRAEINRHKGSEVFTKGDEFLVTFDGPARAVRCAIAIRETAGELGLQVRAGVHTGEIELRGDDVAGIAVHIGARIMATAQPGEILVSRTVTDLVAGSGLQFEDGGSHKLKGVDNEWQLFAVR